MRRFLLVATYFAASSAQQQTAPAGPPKPVPVTITQAPLLVNPPTEGFSGKLLITPTGDGVHWRLEEPLTFWSAGLTLTAPQGFETDGASIPRALWTLVGSPFTGKYVAAAVIHDIGCVRHTYTWKQTDRMFYNAMLASGVATAYAKLLYYGVLVGGPRWSTITLKAETRDQIAEYAQLHPNASAEQLRPSHDALGTAIPVMPANPLNREPRYDVRFVELLRNPELTQEKLADFQTKLEMRESSSPMSVEDIEAEAEQAQL